MLMLLEKTYNTHTHSIRKGQEMSQKIILKKSNL